MSHQPFGDTLAGRANPQPPSASRAREPVDVEPEAAERGQLELAARQYKAIVQSSTDAIIGKNLSGIVTSWNQGAERIFGYSAAEMIGAPVRRLIPEERIGEEDVILARIQRGETVDHFETVRCRKDGARISVSVTISPIHDRSGRIIGASKIARDITDQKADEARLQLTANVFTHAYEGILITDAEGRIIEANEAFCRISGYTTVDLLGQTPSMFSSSHQSPEALRGMLHDLRQQGHCRGEVWSRRKDGVAYVGLVTVSSVPDRSGKTLNYVALVADVTPLRKYQERLEHIAHFDALTELPNRLLLRDRLQQAIAQSRRHNNSLAVLYLDLDGFKEINDRYGHSAGDTLLVALARRMRNKLREVDTLSRIGGDEFVAVLVGVDGLASCLHLVKRILAACSAPIALGSTTLELSASVGVTMFPQDDVDADQLLRHADQAMYVAKQAGKNRYQLFDAAQEAKHRGRVDALDRIERALCQDEFVLHYQPKVNLRTGAVVGVEALIRWQHPERGLVPPGGFLPQLDGHVLSGRVDAWVLNRALAQLEEWTAQGLHLPISVNIGAMLLQQASFAGLLDELLAQYPTVDPADLELEIIESCALEDISAISSIMQACHKLGVRFSVDDFGTGYSSLTYLRRLPADVLKIDQSFVRGMLESQEDLAIVRGVIGLAASFHRTVIAEGVETDAHAKLLLELGCDLAQGYGIARPMPVDQLPTWLVFWSKRFSRG